MDQLSDLSRQVDNNQRCDLDAAPGTLRQVPFFDYPSIFAQDKDGITAVIVDVLQRGAFILQEDLREFEASLAEYLGTKHVIGVADGTNAILLGLRALELQPGSEVIMASHTYVATAAAAHFAGLTPVLVECGSDHMIDPQSLEAAVTPRTRVIMPTQLNGRTADMDALEAIADRHGLVIAEDAAQALGSRFLGRCAATFGVFGTISFYPAKLLGCFGDGGAIVTNDDEIARRVRLLRDHGRDEEGRFVAWGTNCRLDNLQAAVLRHRFNSYDASIARRRAIASLYQTALSDLSQVQLPPGPDADSKHFDVYQNYEIEADRRDDLQRYLRANGIGSAIQWAGRPLHQISALGLNYDLPYTDQVFRRCLMLPMNPMLGDEDVEYVCAVVRAFYGSSGERKGFQHPPRTAC